VIDGLSSDGSPDVIACYASRINKCVSEKDAGIFNAMNKGVRLAKGEYVFFLNSGDYLHSADTLDKIFKYEFSEDFVVFDTELAKSEGHEIRRVERNPKEILILGEVCHQAVFHHRRVFQRLGLYDESFKLAADYELLLRALFRAGCSHQIIHEVLSVYDCVYGLSSDPVNASLLHDERRAAQKRVFDPEIVDALDAQYRQIESLSRIKVLYDGLLASNTVKAALWASAVLRRMKRLIRLKPPGPAPRS